MTTIEYKLLKEFRKLSQDAKREVFAYVKWIRDVEDRERLKSYNNHSSFEDSPLQIFKTK